MKIIVTQEHIDNGIPEDACGCPIALAVCAALSSSSVAVDKSGITVSSEFAWDDYPTPLDARDFIDAFDSGLPVTPFEFYLDVTP